jgi:hypothetical protein
VSSSLILRGIPVKIVPSSEDWTHIDQTASPAEAFKLWQLSIECLDATKSQEQEGWGGESESLKESLSSAAFPATRAIFGTNGAVKRLRK